MKDPAASIILQNLINILRSPEMKSVHQIAFIHGWSCAQKISLENEEKINEAKKYVAECEEEHSEVRKGQIGQ